MCTSPSLTQDPGNADQQSTPEGDMEHLLDPTATTASTEVDLKDSTKYCVLCAASFNNPQMALQHYNGRKHQRNEARQELLKELGDDVQQGNTDGVLTFCSAEQYKVYQTLQESNSNLVHNYTKIPAQRRAT